MAAVEAYEASAIPPLPPCCELRPRELRTQLTYFSRAMHRRACRRVLYVEVRKPSDLGDEMQEYAVAPLPPPGTPAALAPTAMVPASAGGYAPAIALPDRKH